ncbi:hypothetical protein ALC62_10886 [Cyphomyrmex costatus]|uniref:Uncharacterized protein n=1 Tax=Cyphomyrmex costatus TaxID=456900 RepID=A0A151IDC4_9HYME|nr:hypothetical protein ALC62_10886 [Cyphomyrmex costatus]
MRSRLSNWEIDKVRKIVTDLDKEKRKRNIVIKGVKLPKEVENNKKGCNDWMKNLLKEKIGIGTLSGPVIIVKLENEEKKKKRRFEEFIEKETEKREEEELELKNIRREAEVWRYINRKRERKVWIENNIGKEDWCDYFMELLEGSKEEVKIPTRSYTEEEQTDDTVSEEKIGKALYRLKSGKVVGIDGIPTEAWKYAGESVWNKLVKLIKMVRKEGIMSEDWKRSIIVPFYKRGDRRKQEIIEGYPPYARRTKYTPRF